MEQTQSRPRTMTLDAYLAFEETADRRHEFHALPGDPGRGEVLAMSGATEPHCVASANLSRLVGNAIQGTGCRAMSESMRIFAPGSIDAAGNDAGSRHLYPDLSVRCEQPRFAGEDHPATPPKRTTLLNPKAIFEVLSPSTEKYDRFDKFAAYRSIPSLREYVLIQQDRPAVEVYTLREDGGWSFDFFLGSPLGGDTEAKLPGLGITLSITDLYDGVEMDPVSWAVPADER